MSTIASSQANDSEPGQLLHELERRQDDVLRQLDDLEAQLAGVLQGLGVSVEQDPEQDLA